MRLPGTIVQGILARAALVLLRLYLGLVLLLAGLQQIGSDAAAPAGLLFAGLVGWGEILLGAALILGLFTRLAAAGALLLQINSMLAGAPRAWEPSSNKVAFGVISLALLIGAAGRTLGLDGLLARRWPRSPLW
jgi:uncharacterized membrane protein YphA (DoxX/SURF4 family)